MSIVAAVFHALATPLGIAAVIFTLFLVLIIGCARLCFGVLFQIVGLDDEDFEGAIVETKGEEPS